MRILSLYIFILAVYCLCTAGIDAEDRFPRPEIGGSYQMPATTQPQPRPGILEWLDLSVLAIVLLLAADFALRRRSRNHIFFLVVFSCAYFGFWRHGCICSVGAIQNFFLALSNSGYLLPLSVFLFFALPIAAALFFGRVFCAAACPLGAIQDICALAPLKIPGAAQRSFGMIRCLTLAVAILLAITASEFSICRHDPFVPLFRLSGRFEGLMAGAFMLLLGVVIARPYCRFLCPYGLILGWMSCLSKWHLKTSPGKCVNCGKCFNACPFGAVIPPVKGRAADGTTKLNIKRLLLLAALLIVLVGAGALTGAKLAAPLSGLNPNVRLASLVCQEEASGTNSPLIDTMAFEKSGMSSVELYRKAAAVEKKFRIVASSLGAFIGLIFFLSIRTALSGKANPFYEIDRALCVSCGRCLGACPVKEK